MQLHKGVERREPVSRNLNPRSLKSCAQESECAPEATGGTIRVMKTRFILAATFSFATLVFAALFACTPLVWADPVNPAHTTIVVNGAENLAPGEWDAFVTALRSNLQSAENAAAGIDDDPTILPDSEVVLGHEMDEPLVVFLHGNCTPRLDGGPRFEGGRLGWVNEEHGAIEPFIHIECDNIARMLEPVFFHLQRKSQINAMGEAMARATLHEWVHVKRQQPSHDKTGIEKAHYSLRDLIPDFCTPVPGKPEACFPAYYGGAL